MKYSENAVRAVLQHREQGDWLPTLASFVQIAIEYSKDPKASAKKQVTWLNDIKDMLQLTDHWFELTKRPDNLE
ncbi:MAG: hypothetical protein AAGL23_01445 [Pseudomonadota bacterium]